MGGRSLPPGPRLKTGSGGAEAQGEMTARPLLLRRSLAVPVLLAVLALAGLPAAARGGAHRAADPAWAAGEAGSGPVAWRSVPEITPPRRSGAASGIRWSDVPRRHWARQAVDFVAATNDWMRDRGPDPDGTYRFEPEALETRALFARAVVRAFAPDVPAAPEVSFADLPVEDRLFASANVAVSLGWMVADEQGNFRPAEPVTMREVHRALVLALGMGDLAAGADALHLRNGTAIPVPPDFGTTLIGMRLGLRYDHDDESLEVVPDSPLPRAEVAWSLYRAATAPSWMRDSLSPYATMRLPNLSPKLQQLAAFAASYVGYPYVWGGEWDGPTPLGYCCGPQATGGFDCSGITWWVLKAESGGWDNRPPRAYRGWALPERSSAQMAAVGDRVAWEDLRPGDLMFYDGNGDGTVDHVNTYLGNGWAIDSASGNTGVTITSVRGNWYEERFVHGRRILGRPSTVS